MLSRIWDLSDLDRDGRLSLREFVCAMHLLELAKAGKQLPKRTTHDDQERMARSVERMLALGRGAPPRSSLTRGVSNYSTADASFGGFDSQDPPTDAETAMAHLEQALANIGKLDTGIGLELLGQQVLQARRQLHLQLSRRSETAQKLTEARQRLDELQENWRRAEAEASTATRRLTHLEDELSYLGVEVDGAAGDVSMLRELTAGLDQLSAAG